jgi:hypothetical protein
MLPRSVHISATVFGIMLLICVGYGVVFCVNAAAEGSYLLCGIGAAVFAFITFLLIAKVFMLYVRALRVVIKDTSVVPVGCESPAAFGSNGQRCCYALPLSTEGSPEPFLEDLDTDR